MGSARMNLKAAPPKESQYESPFINLLISSLQNREQAKIIQKKLRPNQSVSNTSRYISGLPTYGKDLFENSNSWPFF
jgi:hypothetical protein